MVENIDKVGMTEELALVIKVADCQSMWESVRVGGTYLAMRETVCSAAGLEAEDSLYVRQVVQEPEP